MIHSPQPAADVRAPGVRAGGRLLPALLRRLPAGRQQPADLHRLRDASRALAPPHHALQLCARRHGRHRLAQARRG